MPMTNPELTVTHVDRDGQLYHVSEARHRGETEFVHRKHPLNAGEWYQVRISDQDAEKLGFKELSKSHKEREALREMVESLPVKERDLINQMVLSLLASVGNPISGKAFMLAIAIVNVEVACNAIDLGVVGPNGEFTN